MSEPTRAAGPNTATERLLERARQIVEAETPAYMERTRLSAAANERAREVMPLGLPANGQMFRPSPMVAKRARGARLEDLDGNTYIDFNMGYGALFVGHAHPGVVAAVTAQMQEGSIYLMPSESNTEVARALRERYDQPLWRFTNSGTETTMPAIRAARAFTGRSRVVKAEGGYHGQYDWILSSHKPPLERAGPAGAMKPVGGSTGIPDNYFGLTSIVPFNDLEVLEQTLRTEDAACFIVEPALTNIGIVLPDPGYLAGARELCDRTGTLLIFDEVKIGITAAWGGATAYYGVHPDILCVSKSIGGGLPLGAFGGRADIMENLRPGGVTQVGTFSGNPLGMAASRAVLVDICTPGTTTATIDRATRLTDGMAEIVAKHDLPAQTFQLGARGCLTWSDQPIRNYRDTLSVRTPLALAQWIFGINRGTLMPPGHDSQWLMSVQHTDADVDATVEIFSDYVAALTS